MSIFSITPLLVLILPFFIRGAGPESVWQRSYNVRLAEDTTRTAHEVEQDSVLALLASLDQGPFENAYSHLTSYGYTRYARTEQFDAEDYMIAFTERITQIDTSGVMKELQADSSGRFDYGFFNRFVSENVSTVDPVNLVPHLLPEDPPYLSSRKRDRFTYRFRPDTLLWDTAAQVIEIKARPEVGDDQNIRRVRLYVGQRDHTLLAIYLERIDLALLFREESDYFTHIRKTKEGDWVPYNTRYHTRIRTPFRSTRQFRTVATYYSFVPKV